MGSRQRTRWFAVLIVVVSSLAVACGGNSGGTGGSASPATSAVPSATTATSASPAVTAVPLPVMPPEMANNDAAGAEAAVRYFVELYNYVHLSRDLAPWLEVSDDDCVFCESAAQSVREMSANGEKQVGGLVHLDELRLVQSSEEVSAYSFEARARQDPYEIWNGSDQLVEANSSRQTTDPRRTSALSSPTASEAGN